MQKSVNIVYWFISRWYTIYYYLFILFTINPRKPGFFLRLQSLGGVDSTANLATLRSSNLTHLKVGYTLANWPMTILNRYKLFLSQSEASVNFGGPWNTFNWKSQILSDFRFSNFWSNFRFSFLFLDLYILSMVLWYYNFCLDFFISKLLHYEPVTI